MEPTMDTHDLSSSAARRVILALLCLAQFMLILDIVVVNVALPSIKAGLGIPESRLQLTSIAYTLTFGSLLIVAGRAGDLIGRKRLLLAGLVIFTVASLLTGIAQEGWQLFASRALQGVGAAMVSPTALAVLTSTFAEGRERNWALGLWSAVASSGAIAGQLLGGLLTELAGWRWIFLINVPIGVVVTVVAARLIPESRLAGRTRLDLLGAVILAAALATLTLALSRVAEHGVDARFAAALTVAALLLAGFITWERRHPAPLVRFGLLGQRGVWTGNVALALNAGALGAALYFTTLYLQQVLDYTPLVVGVAFAPVTLVVLLVSPQAARLSSRYGARNLLLTGTTLLGVGLLYLAAVPATGNYIVNVLPGLLLCALGSGLSYVPTFIAGTSGVAEEDQGLASGLLSTSQEIGTAIGLALLASLSVMVARSSDLSGVADTLTAGYRAGFLGGAALMGVALLVALCTPRHVGQDRRSDASAGEVAVDDTATVLGKTGNEPPPTRTAA